MQALASCLVRPTAQHTAWYIRVIGTALTLCAAIASAEPPTPWQEAARLWRAGAYDAAQTLLSDLPADVSNESYSNLMLRAEIALARGEPEQALLRYQQANRVAGHAVAAELGQVRADLQAGEFTRAKAFATLVAGEHRDIPEALALRAWFEDRIGQTERALAALQTARGKAPDDVALLGAYAEILIDRGGGQEAASALETWMRRNRPRGDIYALRARAALAMGERDVGLRWRARAALAYTASGERTRAATFNHWLSHADPAGQSLAAVILATPSPMTMPDAPVLVWHEEHVWHGPYFTPFPASVGAALHTGSGFVIDAGRRVVTSTAVIKDARGDIVLRNGLGDVRHAQVEWADDEAGIAVLRLTEPYRAAWSILSDHLAEPTVGSLCFVMGYPLADTLDPLWPAIGPGLVFRRQVDTPGRTQITSALGPGSDGSPVFDASGRVIGSAFRDLTPAAGGKPGGGKSFVLSSSLLRHALAAVGVTTRADVQPGPPAAHVEALYERMLPAVVLVVAP
jgi:S1-C subfamily serine protease/thioredoxin-like negative regulator of GroEL